MMFDKSLFLYYVMRRKLTLGAIARKLQVNPATLTRKMGGNSDFTRNEIQQLKQFLSLTVDEADKIFFAEKLA